MSEDNEDLFDGFSDSMELIRDIVYKEYYGELSKCKLLPLKDFGASIDDVNLENKNPSDMFSLRKIKKITYKKNEDVIEKLTSIYNSSMIGDFRLVFIINGFEDKPTDIYIGVVGKVVQKGVAISTLEAGIQGHFSGSEFEELSDNKKLFDMIFSEQQTNISTVSSLGSRRDKSYTEDKKFLQGIEHLIDSMEGKEYVALFLSQAVPKNEITEITTNYENLYTTLSQFNKATFSQNESETEGVNETDTTGTSTGNNRSRGIAKTTGISFGASVGGASSSGNSSSMGVGAGMSFIGSLAGTLASAATSMFTGTLGLSFGLSFSRTLSQNWGTFESKNTSKSIGISTSTTNGTSVQYEVEDKNITRLLENIDLQLNRLRDGEDYGLFFTGSYFLSTRPENAMLAANIYKSLLNGDGVSCERSAINFWSKSKNSSDFDLIKEYLKRGYNPTFLKQTGVNQGISCTPATLVTGLSLPLHIGFPHKSVYGLSVIEHAEFGRNIINTNTEENLLPLGNFYHMGKISSQQVNIGKDELTKHTLITGTTGSGKSNTIYNMLDNLKKDVPFLVIEPTKGEYKGIFGNKYDVFVYGTNPNETPILRLNPFEFHKNIHVLEHIDRLVDIFNVCWPMYAAMPAILKDSVEKAYVVAGWNLVESVNTISSNLFPNFEDVLEQISIILNESEYSAENKGNYVGALSTRIRSLTTGLNGMIFTQNCLSNEELFEKNVIVDLSRLHSAETKALVMGLLVTKLSEFNMISKRRNAKLNHITVLEEAHLLLKRTSTEQISESSNLLGKSVEMLANSIAEMRTYGEGFIIADQSPNMLDMSAIRNTNTKIIMNLPEESDRILVGKSANLNDDQILEISRLKQGVAVIYQNNWLEAVLCQISKFDGEYKDFEVVDDYDFNKFKDIKDNLIELIASNKLENIDDYQELVLQSNLKASFKAAYFNLLSCETPEKDLCLIRFIYELFDGRKAFNNTKYVDNIENWKRCFMRNTSPPLNQFSNNLSEYVIDNLLKEQLLQDPTYTDIANEIFTLNKIEKG